MFKKDSNGNMVAAESGFEIVLYKDDTWAFWFGEGDAILAGSGGEQDACGAVYEFFKNGNAFLRNVEENV